ncbi:hypothetical protein MTO96_012900 [Rhipicephalus appendiculatus]
MDISDYKAGTPPRGLQDVSMLQSQENGMPSSSRNRFRVLPKALSKFLCTEEDNPAIGLLVGSTSFIAGIGTLVQTTAGVRLPVIQSGALTMASPAVAELKYDIVPCPDNSTFDDEIWTSRILEVCLCLFLQDGHNL